MSIYFVGDQILFFGDDVAMDAACCCDTVCPCCYYGIQIKRGSGASTPIRGLPLGTCVIGSYPDTVGYAMQCGDETFLLTMDPTPPEGCVCYGSYYSDTNNHTANPCEQAWKTPPAEDQVCNYTMAVPKGPNAGIETHIGTVTFQHIYTVSFCYDPCGTCTISINHKIYGRFGVWVHDEPPPLIGPVTDNLVVVYSDELMFDSTWTWTGVTTTNCTVNPDLGPATSESLSATDYTKTWGTAYTNCGGSSSFTMTFAKPCVSTGMILLGGGAPCECGDPPASPEGYFADGYFADGYFSSGYFTESTSSGTYSGYFADGYFADGYFMDGY